jgi:hypothetical protein
VVLRRRPVEADAIAHAECGDIEPLQKLYPQLAHYLARPPRPRGSHFPKLRAGLDRMACAANDVRRIRALWKHYYRTFRRRLDQPPSVEAIACERWQIADVDRLIAYLKSRAHMKARRSSR